MYILNCFPSAFTYNTERKNLIVYPNSFNYMLKRPVFVVETYIFQYGFLNLEKKKSQKYKNTIIYNF